MGLACCGACSFAAQEAFPAVDRTSLGRLERHRCLPPALGALGSGFRFGEAGTGGTLPLRFTRFAALGFILEVFVVEEVLFSRCENEIRAAIHAFENAVLKLRHGLFPVNNLSNLFGTGETDRLACTFTLGSVAYSTSRRDFFRFRFRASACLTRSFSPGLR